MKDKINKTNHKRWYYTTRRMSVLSLLVFGGAASFAIPTYISLKNSEIERLKAAEKEDSDSDEASESPYMLENTFLSYQ